MTTIQMDDDDGLGEYFLYGVVARTDEARILLGVLLDMSHGPEQPVGRLVAHLHPAWRHTVLLQQLQHVDGVCAQVAFHLLVAVSLPGGGNGLLTGVGPRVGIVEVHHQVHT